MSTNPDHRRPLSTRMIFSRREIGRFAALRQHIQEEHGSTRQPSKFSLLLLIALATVGMIAAISIIQLVEASLR
jgi:hypothetical protein